MTLQAMTREAVTRTPQRILVVANEPASSTVLAESLVELVGASDVEVLAVAPAPPPASPSGRRATTTHAARQNTASPARSSC